jgi:hypothetical protein
MTFFGMALLTAAATVVLAVFAIVTAWYARKAFIKQSQEVAAIEQQVADEQKLTRQQGELLQVQAEQVSVLRAQLEDQLKASAKQAEVLELQAADLREAVKERKREAEERRRAQAERVYVWRDSPTFQPGEVRVAAHVRNTSHQPVFGVQVTLWGKGKTLLHQVTRGAPLLPGQEDDLDAKVPASTDFGHVMAAAVFRDRSGRQWCAYADGKLEEHPAEVGLFMVPGGLAEAARESLRSGASD